MDLIEFVSSYSMAQGERLDALGAGARPCRESSDSV